jgi:hypothetical protein
LLTHLVKYLEDIPITEKGTPPKAHVFAQICMKNRILAIQLEKSLKWKPTIKQFEQ